MQAKLQSVDRRNGSRINEVLPEFETIENSLPMEDVTVCVAG